MRKRFRQIFILILLLSVPFQAVVGATYCQLQSDTSIHEITDSADHSCCPDDELNSGCQCDALFGSAFLTEPAHDKLSPAAIRQALFLTRLTNFVQATLFKPPRST